MGDFSPLGANLTRDGLISPARGSVGSISARSGACGDASQADTGFTNDILSTTADGEIIIDARVESIIPSGEDAGALEVVVSGIPEGARLTEGTDNGDRTWSMTVMQLAVLAIALPATASFAGEAFALNVEVSRQGEDGEVISTAAIEVDAQADFNQSEVVRVLIGPAAVQAGTTDTTTQTQQAAAAAEAAATEEAAAQATANAASDADGDASTAKTGGGSGGTAEADTAEVVETVVVDESTETAATDTTVDASTEVAVETTTETTADTDTDTTIETTQTTTSSTSSSTESTTSTEQTETVQADVSAPDLTVTAASGDEDGAIALDISSALVDGDSLSVVISGVPTGATLSAGTDNGDGTWTLTSAQLTGLTITPSSNDDSDFTLSVTATASDDASTADSVQTLNVTVSGVVDTPSLSVAAASGGEDTAISLSISSALTDTDGSESLTVVISGVPTGATLSAGTDNGDGTWSLIQSQLSDLSITPPSDDDGDFTLTVTATASEGGSTSQSVGTIDVSVAAVADAPSLSVAAASGNEDTAISLSLSSALTDTDGSESLGIVISGVPTGATLSAGTDNGDGTWTLTSAQLSGLSITPPSDDDSDFTLTVTATATDGASTTQSVGTVAVTVGAVADAPSLSAGNVSGNEDTAISLSLSAALTDTDGSESLGVVISGVPVGAQFSAGTNNGDGSWSFTSAQLSGLTVTPPPDRDTNFTLSVAVTATDGSDTATTNGSFTVTINPVADTPNDITFSSDAVDENATNGTVVGTASGVDPDTGETFTYALTNDAGGRFAIDANTGEITVADGSLLDFEAAMSHDITIRVTDSTGKTYDETKAITLNDLSEFDDTHQAEVVGAGAVGYWRLGDANATAVDEISGSNGTWVNNTVYQDVNDPFSNINNLGSNFDGVDDYVSIPDSAAWNQANGTIQLWFNADTVSGADTLISRDPSGGNPGDFYIDRDGSDITVRMRDSDGGTLTASNVVTAGNWYQLTVTFGSGGLEIYIDGTRVAYDAAITAGIDGGSSNVLVGAYDGPSYFFDGKISEVAIFDSQLPEATIDGLYSAGANGTDLLTLTSGADTNTGTAGEDFIAGAAGNDTISGAAGEDRLYGDGGDDTLNGGDGADILMGGDGADSLFGDALADVLSGGDGNDTLTGGAGADTLLGGAGSDTASYATSASAINVNLNTGAATGGDAQGDTFTSIENLTGSNYNDGLVGDGNVNILTGGAGNDTLQGLGGADTLYGGVGSDTFIVGEGGGNDTIDGGAAGGWTDSITLQNADSSSVGTGWTISLTNGSEQSDNGSTKTFTDDAAGTITLEDGTEIGFQNIESVNY
jgi:large repetitive protein